MKRKFLLSCCVATSFVLSSCGVGGMSAMDNSSMYAPGTQVDISGNMDDQGTKGLNLKGAVVYNPILNVFFGSGSYNIDRVGEQGIYDVAQLLHSIGAKDVVIIGYSDNRGHRDKNEKLAMNRALEVKKKLSELVDRMGLSVTIKDVKASLHPQKSGMTCLLKKKSDCDRRVTISYTR